MKFLFMMLLSLFLFTGVAFGGTAHLIFDGSPSSNLQGYKVYYGSNSSLAYDLTLGNYTGTEAVLGASPIDIGNVTDISLEIIPTVATKFYFTVVGYDEYGNLSSPTNQVNKIIGAVDPPSNLQIE